MYNIGQIDMRCTLRQLEVFAEVARDENVSRAARALNLSQSAASTALSEFERLYDRPLFDRIGKRLHLNERGRRLLPQVLALLDQASELESRLRNDDSLGDLRLGATLTIGNYLATLLVAEFMNRYPDSRVTLQVHNTATIVERLLAHEIDLALIEGECHRPELETEPWIEDALTVFCAPGHPLAAHQPVSVHSLEGEAWIMRERGSGTRDTLESALSRLGVAPRIRFELEHTEAVKRSVECGLGLGCISRLALRDAFRRGSLVPLSVPELDLRRRFQFVCHRGKYRNLAMQTFVQRCKALTQGLRSSDEIVLPVIP